MAAAVVNSKRSEKVVFVRLNWLAVVEVEIVVVDGYPCPVDYLVIGAVGLGCFPGLVRAHNHSPLFYQQLLRYSNFAHQHPRQFPSCRYSYLGAAGLELVVLLSSLFVQRAYSLRTAIGAASLF